MKAWLARNWLPIAAFAAGLLVYGVVAGGRLRRQSADPHFVLQADAWLHKRLDIAVWPAGADDPSKVEEVELDDGTHVRGRRISIRKSFRILGGEEIPQTRIKSSVQTVSYVSFPPFPAVLMIPQVLIHGARANDVGTTVFVAALIPALLLLVFRRLREKKLSERTVGEDVWLTALLCFGTVLFFSSVQGRVWFTAHVVAVALCLGYVWASLEGDHPIVAGLCLGLAFVTRPPMMFMVPFFAFESWRRGREGFLKRALLFAAPVVVVGILAAWHNYARYHELGEFGHSYLVVRQQAMIEKYGLVSIHYLGRNLAVALALLPEFSGAKPYLTISGHGLALWFTTPILVLLAWPAARGPLHRSLWLTILPIAIFDLLYQNSGWLQFGYRFALDYMVFLVLLLAVGGRRLGWLARGLIIFGIAVNLFGAITFARMPKYYRSDNGTYNCVIPH